MSLTLVSSSQSSCLSLLSARMLDIHLYVQLQPGFGAIINLDTFFFFPNKKLKNKLPCGVLQSYRGWLTGGFAF